MASALPEGDPAPRDGRLPASAAVGAVDRDFGVYIHVPFCRVRCGYCDFNTYTVTELRGASQSSYADEAIAEIAFAARVLRESGVSSRPAATIYFGGGTPTLLPSTDLLRMKDAVAARVGIATGCEITTEANPDSVNADDLHRLADAGFTRVSFGMQSAVPHVLATLDRTHDPDRVPVVVDWARAAGLEVSLDLIYGTPGESFADWQTSVEAALSCAPDHLSAYALIVERGTKLARQIASGDVAEPDDDLEADKYEWADARLAEAGYAWYELSNWARAGRVSRHNLNYWLGQDWWGVGPGAHSHIGGTRWWNVKHPAAYAQRMAAHVSPAAAREVLSPATRHEERVLLETRLATGMAAADIGCEERILTELEHDGLITRVMQEADRVQLTLRGRLLADAVVRRLLD